ncbi:MAG: glutamate mutase L [Candidatus Limnocylindria bacterium]
MSVPVTTEAALLVDVGSAWTKASLIGRARGRWRVVAHAAGPTSWGAAELDRALVAQLAESADHRLAGALEGLVAGANRIECHTARRPGRLAIVAVSRELSGAAARRAAESAGWDVAELATLDDGRSLAERIETLQAAEVDAWLLAGGFDDGRSQRALEVAALVAAARRPESSPVIWAGSAALAAEVAGLFEDDAVATVANPRPDAGAEAGAELRSHLEVLLRRTLEPESEIHLAPVALRRAVREIARAGGLHVLGVDIGARYAVRANATPDGDVESRVFANGGMSTMAGAGPTLAARVARALGHGVDEPAVADLLQNLRARPTSLPQTDDELAVIQAAARIQLASMAEDAPVAGVDLLIGTGRTLASAPQPGQAARMLIDGLRPLGVTQLALDPAGLLGPLGALPDDEITEGVALLADDIVVSLGTAVVSRGGEPGRLAMRVTVHRAGWPSRAPIELRAGQLQIVSLPAGQEAELVIEPADGVSLGAPRRSPRIHAAATGGSVGLILDARGVPIVLPRRADDRRAVLLGWHDAFQREATAAEALG